ncbi:MAG: SRPBCC domain-containing protein [Kofleriaceae bacterium]
MSVPAPIPTTEVVVTRTIAASPTAVYDVWMDPACPGGPWFGAAQLIFEPGVDKLYFFAVDHEGRRWHHYGRFLRLDRGVVAAYTWMSEATQGLESVVTVTFDGAGAGTQVTIRHAGVPDDEFGRQHGEGWTFILGSVAQRLEA